MFRRGYALTAGEASQVGRFVVAGAVNTVISTAVYQLALFVAGHVVSYAIAYIAGTAIAYYGYSSYVFRARFSRAQPAVFAAFYAVSLAAGTALNAVIVEYIGVPERIAIFATIGLMLPFNYLGSRWSLRGDSAATEPGSAGKPSR